MCLLVLGVTFVALSFLFRCLQRHAKTRRIFSYAANTLGVVLLYMAVSGAAPMIATAYSSMACMDAPLPVVLPTPAKAYPPMTTSFFWRPAPLCRSGCVYAIVSVRVCVCVCS